MSDRHGWAWFALWALPGVVLGFQVSAVGILLAPVGLLVAWLLVRATGLSAETLGLLLGVAVVFLVVAVLNAGGRGLDARPWLVAALVCAAVGVAGYAAGARRRRRA